MSKYKRKKKKTPAQELREDLRKINRKLWLVTFLCVAVLFGIYQLCIALRFKYIVHIYAVALFVLAVCYGIINRGFSGKKITCEDLPSDWDPERKHNFVEDMEDRRKKAKLYLIPIIGILLSFAYDIVYLFYIEPLL